MASGKGSDQSVLTIAYRGASQQAPENTVPAIEKALKIGADVVALDVQSAKDGEPVVIADTRLDRTTDQTGRVIKLSVNELQALDAGSWFKAEFKNTRIPSLEEAVKAVGSKARLLLNLPEMRGDSPLAANILKVLGARKKPVDDLLVFQDSESLKSFRDAAPDFSYVLALGDRIEGWVILAKAEKLGLKIVRPHRSQVDAGLVRKAHEKNLQVFVHFTDEEEDMQDLLQLRVDGIVTGRPERLKRVLEGQGSEA